MMNKEVQDSLKQVGIRMVEEPPLLSPEPMDNPEAAVRVLGEWLSEMDRELFCVVNLNSHLTPITGSHLLAYSRILSFRSCNSSSLIIILF